LQRKEAVIDDWQKKKVAKARQKMRKTEVRFLTTYQFEMDRTVS
jgi:hypothetical protein